MKPHRRKRLIMILYIVVGISLSVSLVLYALKQNISLYYTPTQVLAGQTPTGSIFRVGGLVEKGTLKMDPKKLSVIFALSDLKQSLIVNYQGVLPDLFREGQGVVADGSYDPKTQVFTAVQILAKHDASYMPPEVAAELHNNAT